MTGTAKKVKYSYTALNDVRVNSKVNVFGVVKFLKQPYKTRGSDFCLVMSLIDETLPQPDQGLKCLLFGKQENLLPVSELGDVVRFHRLSINQFHGLPQGQSSPGFSWLLFSGDTDSSLEPIKASSCTYQLTDEDKEQVKRLRLWASGKQELVEKLSTFHQVGANCYFDLVCQVVSVAVLEPGVCVLLRVWDGTRTIYQVTGAEKEFQEGEISTDVILEERAEDLLYDVFVYDNHTQTASKIKPGSYAKFKNLHAAVHKAKDDAGNESTIPTLEFILHRGDSFGRGIRVLSHDNKSVNTLKERLERFDLPTFSSETEFTFIKNIAAKDSGNQQASDTTSREEDENRNVISGDTREASGEVVDNGGASTDPVDNRCMLQTKTVVLNHPHVKRSSLKEVLDHTGPGKFRVCAQILAHHPATDHRSSFLKLHCRICNHLCDLPQQSIRKSSERQECQLEIGSSFQGVPHYLCPNCSAKRNSLPELDSPPHLNYVYMMRFLLKDDTGMLIANIWREDAVVFFKNIKAEEVIQSNWQFSQIQDMLEEICLGSRSGSQQQATDKRPWVECCIRSFRVDEHWTYQIFDTAVV